MSNRPKWKSLSRAGSASSRASAGAGDARQDLHEVRVAVAGRELHEAEPVAAGQQAHGLAVDRHHRPEVEPGRKVAPVEVVRHPARLAPVGPAPGQRRADPRGECGAREMP